LMRKNWDIPYENKSKVDVFLENNYEVMNLEK